MATNQNEKNVENPDLVRREKAKNLSEMQKFKKFSKSAASSMGSFLGAGWGSPADILLLVPILLFIPTPIAVYGTFLLMKNAAKGILKGAKGLIHLFSKTSKLNHELKRSEELYEKFKNNEREQSELESFLNPNLPEPTLPRNINKKFNRLDKKEAKYNDKLEKIGPYYSIRTEKLLRDLNKVEEKREQLKSFLNPNISEHNLPENFNKRLKKVDRLEEKYNNKLENHTKKLEALQELMNSGKLNNNKLTSLVANIKNRNGVRN